MDGGIRRGTDIVKAFAWERAPCCAGAPTPMGFAAGGEAGVDRAIEILRTDLERTLRLLGCPSVAELDRFLRECSQELGIQLIRICAAVTASACIVRIRPPLHQTRIVRGDGYAVDPDLRPARALVALHAGGCASHRRSFRSAGWSQSEASLVRDCGRIDRGGGCHHLLQDASCAGGHQLWVRGCFRSAENRLDRAGRGLSLRHFRRDRAIRDHEGVSSGNHCRTAGCKCCWWPSVLAHSSKALRASARRLRLLVRS